MNKIVIAGVLFIFLAACSSPRQSEPVPAEASTAAAAGPTSASGIAWKTDLPAALEVARAEHRALMLDFYADWCHWCKKLDAETWADARVAAAAARFVCVKIDADRNSESAAKYGATGLPTIVFLGSDGSVIKTVVGFRDAGDMLAVMEEAASHA